MKLIVGLGNPGRQYAGTRHNVGFAVAETLTRRFGQATPRGRFHGETVEVQLGQQRTMLLCPHTLMNRSGLSVLEARDFYKLDLADVLIICQSGGRSFSIATALAERGYRAIDVLGGMAAWRRSGLPVALPADLPAAHDPGA